MYRLPQLFVLHPQWFLEWTVGIVALLFVESSANFFIPFAGIWITSFVICPFMCAWFDRNPQYRLVPMKWTESDLVYQLDSTIVDLCLLFPICVWFVTHIGIKLVLTEATEIENFYRSPISWLLIPVTNIVGLAWRMAIHAVFHHPKLYKWHKRHHAPPEKFTPFIAWNDSIVEFLFMEFFGVMFLPVALNPLPLPVLTLLWSWQIFDGVLNHQNVKVPGSQWWDTEYHTIHHVHVRHNYAEWEALDKFAGTLFTGKVDWVAYNEGLEKRERSSKKSHDHQQSLE